MSDAIIDVRPGILPAGTLRVASNGNEFLVLLDVAALQATHTCNGGGMPWTDDGPYEVFVARGWQTCMRTDSCPAINTTNYRAGLFFDTLADAHAAFDRMEQELRA